MKLKFDVTGMTCAACSARVEKVTAAIEGVSQVEVNLLAGSMTVEAEESKVAIRNSRRDGNDAFKKLAKEEVSEDEIKQLEDQLQKMTDKYIQKLDKAIEAKTKEIMTV